MPTDLIPQSPLKRYVSAFFRFFFIIFFSHRTWNRGSVSLGHEASSAFMWTDKNRLRFTRPLWQVSKIYDRLAMTIMTRICAEGS